MTTQPHSASKRRTVRSEASGTGCLAVLAFAISFLAIGTQPALAEDDKRVIVLGFDGLDYALTAQMIAEGELPNFERVATSGTFAPLGTSIPPQSPVAWSNFITGMDSGGHGIFDFIHRDAETLLPYLSTSRVEDPKSLKLGKLEIPLGGPEHVLLRKGQAFWEVLEEAGHSTMIIRMPANFPPTKTATVELSGMGTPDILGNYGTFRYYTTDYAPFAGRTVGGGKVKKVRVRKNRVKSSIEGPKLGETQTACDFVVYLDEKKPVAKIEIDGQDFIMREGEWSDWVPFSIETGTMNKIDCITRFYLQEVRPEFRLFVTSVDYDPMKPKGLGNSNVAVSHPPSFAKEMAEATGRFFTEGMPEDTKALSEGVLSVPEFLDQAKIPGDETRREYEWVLDEFYERYDSGLLFYYFGNQDQIGHMMWRTMDPGHPAYTEEADAPYEDTVRSLIRILDEVVGHTLDRIDDDTTLVIMSDHGFSSWRRAMNLNAWLRDEGYLAVKDPTLKKDPGLLLNVDWANTRAYGFGLNGLYVNERGREKHGIVNANDKRALLQEIASKLLKVVDDETGKRAITRTYICEDILVDRGHMDIGPDLIVGYAKEMRCSNDSAMGQVPQDVFEDNLDAWSGDHCMDHEAVPGVLFTNRPLKKPAPRLENLAAAILAEFGISGFPGDAETDTELASRLRAIGYVSSTH